MKIKKEELINIIEKVPYDWVNNVSINFQNFQIDETDDEFELKLS